MRPYRIAHLSDPHLSRQYYRDHIKSLKILIRHVIEEGFDHIVVSGDIVSTADPDDYYLAREIFARAGVLEAAKLTVVPGNHDIFGGPHRAVDVLSFPRHIRSVDHCRHHILFRAAFAETFEGTITVGPDSPYPFVKRAGPFALIGLNSIPPWSLRSNLLGSNGLVDDQQLRRLAGLAAGGAWNDLIPVVIMHHHFNDLIDGSVSNGFWKRVESRTMRLRRRRRLIRTFRENGIKAVLHGHIHRNELYERGGLTILNGAGSVCDDPVRMLKFNVIEMQNGAFAASVQTLDIPYQQSTVNLALRRFGRALHVPAWVPQP